MAQSELYSTVQHSAGAIRLPYKLIFNRFVTQVLGSHISTDLNEKFLPHKSRTKNDQADFNVNQTRK